MTVQSNNLSADRPHAAGGSARPTEHTRPHPHESRLRAVVVDAHPLFGDLLARWLAGRFHIDVVATASCAPAAAEACSAHRPELVIINNPDLPGAQGLSVLTAVAAANPAVRIILFGDSATWPPVRDGAIAHDMIATVDGSTGLRGLFDEITKILVALGRDPAGLLADEMLSGREMDVFTRIGQGMPSAAIAGELGISLQTVETHRKSITKKLKANGAELVRIAVLHGMANGPRS